MNVTKIWNYVIPVFYINVIHHLKRGLTLTIKANSKGRLLISCPKCGCTHEIDFDKVWREPI